MSKLFLLCLAALLFVASAENSSEAQNSAEHGSDSPATSQTTNAPSPAPPAAHAGVSTLHGFGLGVAMITASVLFFR